MKNTKLYITAGILLILDGLIILFGTFVWLNMDFKKLNTKNYTTKTFEVKDSFNNIEINLTTTDLTLEKTDDEVCRIECIDEDKIIHTVEIKNDTLIVDTKDTRKWYDFISVSFGNNMKMMVYLTKDQFENLRINTDTGKVNIPNSFSFENIKIDGNTSNIACNSSAKNNIEIETDTGKIEVTEISANKIKLSTDTGHICLKKTKIQDSIEIESDTGKIEIGNIRAYKLTAENNTGKITFTDVICQESLTLQTDTGDINLEECDAKEITVNTGTGDVFGTILSGKIFTAKTSTGKISVPESTPDGICKIHTDTGNINIKIK